MSAKRRIDRNFVERYQSAVPAEPLPDDADLATRIRLLAERVDRGESCFHPDDPPRPQACGWRVPRARFIPETVRLRTRQYNGRYATD